jgi:hypothetical protein
MLLARNNPKCERRARSPRSGQSMPRQEATARVAESYGWVML